MQEFLDSTFMAENPNAQGSDVAMLSLVFRG